VKLLLTGRGNGRVSVLRGWIAGLHVAGLRMMGSLRLLEEGRGGFHDCQ
jgi:hypothetical protein